MVRCERSCNQLVLPSVGGSATRDFEDRVCTGYSSLERGQSTNYCYRLNAEPAEAQMQREYQDGYQVRFSKNGHSLHIDNVDSKKKRGVIPRHHALMVMTLTSFHPRQESLS